VNKFFEPTGDRYADARRKRLGKTGEAYLALTNDLKTIENQLALTTKGFNEFTTG
jgi:hypothetical protein